MTENLFEKSGYDPGSVVADGNRFLIANGYLGIRGTVEEADSTSLPAVNLAGVYDRYEDKWREPVNAPMGLYAKLSFNGKAFALGEAVPLTHKLAIDYGQSLFMRKTDFGPVTISSERMASLAQPHLTAASLTLSFAEDGEAVLKTGISTDIWDLNGPHLFGYKYTPGEVLLCEAVTGEKQIGIAVSQGVSCSVQADEEQLTEQNGIFRELKFSVKSGAKVTVSIFSAVYTGLDTVEPAAEAVRLCGEAKRAGYELCKNDHTKAWADVWRRSEITLEGDPDTRLALKASQYYLNSIAPRHAGNLSIPARGLSGQTYKGAVFWDSEIFLFPMFAYTQPEVAAALLRYRIETLPGARKKAAEYGYRGAFYAWESQEGGT